MNELHINLVDNSFGEISDQAREEILLFSVGSSIFQIYLMRGRCARASLPEVRDGSAPLLPIL